MFLFFLILKFCLNKKYQYEYKICEIELQNKEQKKTKKISNVSIWTTNLMVKIVRKRVWRKIGFLVENICNLLCRDRSL